LIDTKGYCGVNLIKRMRVVHWGNQFLGQIGGEEVAGMVLWLLNAFGLLHSIARIHVGT
jgi:hypothetical protein